jgi:hypothetical protein
MPGVKIVQPLAGTMAVVGCSRPVLTSDPRLVGLGVPLEVGLPSVRGVVDVAEAVADSGSTPHPDMTMMRTMRATQPVASGR